MIAAFVERTFVLVTVVLLSMQGLFGDDRGAGQVLVESGVGVANEGDRLLVALQITNRGSNSAFDVKVTDIALSDARPTRPAKQPILVGDIPPSGSVTLQLSFDRRRLEKGRRYELIVVGEYGRRDRVEHFEIRSEIALPLPDRGRREAPRLEVPLRRIDGVTGPPVPPRIKPKSVLSDEPDRPVPVGRHIGTLDPNARPINRRRLPPRLGRFRRGPQGNATFVRMGSEPLSLPTDMKNGWPPDPSGASVDVTIPPFDKTQPLVFLTGNLYALLSTDGGSNFDHIDPTTLFNNIPLDGMAADGGLCCDMNLVYVPTVDRIVWQMLTGGSPIDPTVVGSPHKGNRLRIAFASPQRVIESGGLAWSLFDITTKSLGLEDKAFLDYPDVHFTSQSLLISVNAMGGLIIIRVPLADLKGSPVIHISHTKPEQGQLARGGRLVHYSPDAAYWAGHQTTSRLRVYEWLDSASSFTWDAIDINSWTDESLWGLDQTVPPPIVTSLTPNGTNWLEANSFSVRGGAYQSDFGGFPFGGARRLVFAWNAPPVMQGNDFVGVAKIPQPHVHVQPVVRKTSSPESLFNLVTWDAEPSFDVWNPNFAFHHAHLASNLNGEIGISVGAGGGGSDATPVAGFLGDNTLYFINSSTTSVNRYGDYTAIRRHWPNERLFSVSDYYLTGPFNVFHQYRLFGRPTDVGN